ncbi:hypothetical protein [Tomitella cavernea]|uniref:Uncharacterized protein n=1 Tax=Tomitella cavernea TaxID=1387982 RepID=A0ABP9CKS1_9ACTN|nr:hypothetical protein [Tomitella cavernea]
MTAPADTAPPVARGVDVLVGTKELRAALSAVLPHASGDPELPMLHCVVCDVGPDELIWWATDNLSAGLTWHEVHSHQAEGLGRFAILPADAKKLLSIFKAGKESEDAPEFIVQIQVAQHGDGQYVIITDQSGLLPGRSYRVPQIYAADAPAPAIDRMLARMHHSSASWSEECVFNGEILARFKAATGAYREPVQVGAVGESRSLIVRCGAHFLGAIAGISATEESERERAAWRAEWSDRLPSPTGGMP